MRYRSFPVVAIALGLVFVAGCGKTAVKYMTSENSASTNNDRQDRLTNHAFDEAYEHHPENRLRNVKEHPLSTFSIDVDTASYSNVRRFLRQRQLPPADAVRIEEFINYFSYDDPQPESGTPFSVNAEVADCPWNPLHRLVRIGLKGKTIAESERSSANLVFLIDVSGSMNNPKKLPLVKDSIKLLTQQLGESDHVGIVVYAGAAGLVLPATSTANKARILQAIESLQPGGSTNGASGIQLAYDVARENFVPGAINRVILCTDGDFNVGITSPQDLQQLIEREARTGVFLTVLGYGMGNLKDSTMELLADRGNGNYGYIDSLAEARKLLVEQMSGTLIAIAKDVKIQVEFNPAKVSAYRLIGYENRRLADRDFNDDTKDAGEIGAGHSVTALYEVVPTGISAGSKPAVDRLRYQSTRSKTAEPVETKDADAVSRELLVVKLRYKDPDGDESRLIEVPVVDAGLTFGAASPNLRFAAAVAQFGMLLTNSDYRGDTTFDEIIGTAKSAITVDQNGHRTEFLELVKLARDLRNEQQRLLARRGR
jgi:Ca-activated chloride channel family protein